MKNESKILIIEDDMLLNDMTKRLLTQHGYCTTSAYSGSEALLLIERSSFDLILLDLMFTKNNIFESVWNENFIGDDNAINVHIGNLRKKFAKVNPEEKYIQTVWGLGFKMQG